MRSSGSDAIVAALMRRWERRHRGGSVATTFDGENFGAQSPLEEANLLLAERLEVL